LINLSLNVKQTNCYVTSSGIDMTRETFLGICLPLVTIADFPNEYTCAVDECG